MTESKNPKIADTHVEPAEAVHPQEQVVSVERIDEEGAILLFDEADALFGKRSEVKDSHDKYS